jgi:hypothetical protein
MPRMIGRLRADTDLFDVGAYIAVTIAMRRFGRRIQLQPLTIVSLNFPALTAPATSLAL